MTARDHTWSGRDILSTGGYRDLLSQLKWASHQVPVHAAASVSEVL